MNFNSGFNPFKKTVPAEKTTQVQDPCEQELRTIVKNLEAEFGSDAVDTALERLASIPGDNFTLENIPPVSSQLVKELSNLQTRYDHTDVMTALVNIEENRGV